MGHEYIIVAGPNGAGKSTLYQARPELFENSYRVNADEILRKNFGDWRNLSDNGRAMKEVIRTMDRLIHEGVSFHQETTLAGSTKGYIRRIQRAKEEGFLIKLFYVGIESPELAIERVNKRVLLGGHGIEESLIRKRYHKSLDHFAELVGYCDVVLVFDNTSRFELIYSSKKGLVGFDHRSDFPWFAILDI